jgi:hypothetical protein
VAGGAVVVDGGAAAAVVVVAVREVVEVLARELGRAAPELPPLHAPSAATSTTAPQATLVGRIQ